MTKRLKTTRSKRSFTLIEIIVCISLLSLLGGLFAFKAKDLFATYQYKTEKTRLINALHLARHLSICYGADVSAHLEKHKHGYTLVFKTEEPALLSHEALLKEYFFTKIQKIAFLKEKKSQEILFSSSGWVFPSGLIEVSGYLEKKEVFDLASQKVFEARAAKLP